MRAITYSLLPLFLFLITLPLSAQEKPFLGIYLGDMTQAKAEKLGYPNTYGSYVTEVVGNTAAERAGLQPFDYIVGIDDKDVEEGRHLGVLLSNYQVGDEVEVHFIRQGKRMTKRVKLGRKSEAVYTEKERCDKAFLGVRSRSNHLPEGFTGVPVGVVPNSTAAELGMQDGDVLLRINGRQMIDWDDIGIAMKALSPGDKIQVDFVRNWDKMSADTKVQSYCDIYGQEEEDTEEKTERMVIIEKRWEEEEKKETREMRDVSDMEVRIGDMPAEEMEQMQDRYGLDMPRDNSLGVQRLTIAPNPSSGMFDLSFNLPQRGDTEIAIYNAQGRLIYQSELIGFTGAYQDEVDISQNGPGTYYLMVRQSGKSRVKKVVVVR